MMRRTLTTPRGTGEIDRPCYVISDTDTRRGTQVSYEDGWCYGKSEYLGEARADDDPRAIINQHARQKVDERNGLPVYYVSDHGNVDRRMCVRLGRRRTRS